MCGRFLGDKADMPLAYRVKVHKCVQAVTVVGSGSFSSPVTVSLRQSSDDSPTVDDGGSPVVVITVILIVAVIGILSFPIVIGFTYWKTIRRKSRTKQGLPEDRNKTLTDSFPLSDQHSFDEIREIISKQKVFPKNSIHLSKVVGHGESGVVYKAFLDTSEGRELVAIKTVKALFASSDVARLTKEIKMMVAFNHPNVMTLRGVCLDQESPLLIMPFMINGTALEFVKKNKESLWFADEDDVQTQIILSARKLLLGMCLQVARGMQYLAAQRVAHRDLAARNCMIDRNGVIKVADFGLTEDMYCTNYFRKDLSEPGNEEKVPIRWMAPESISAELYSEKTDVWSFGVTCWELFTCGRVPYSGIPVMRLPSYLANGERLDKPINSACTDQIFSIITGCWRFGSEERPTFSNLVLEISSLLEVEAGYLDLSLPLIRRENEDTQGAVLNESTHKVTVKNNLESKF